MQLDQFVFDEVTHLRFLGLTDLIAGSLALFGLDALDGPIQVALVLCCAVAGLIGIKNGHPWSAVQEASQGALSSITSAIFILLSVGALIGTWNLSGTIPTLAYYGIQLLAPSYFYIATAVICGVVAMSVGSSWTTAGTIGVGLVGIAAMLGVSTPITAGAVISGAYLGDKLSPLSETTILSAQLVHADVYTHIRAQVWTSVPAFLLAATGFVALGLVGPAPTQTVGEEVELAKLSEIFWINPVNLLPLLLLVVLSMRKAPASLALLAAAEDLNVDAASVWQFDGDPATAVRRLRNRAAVAVACDSLGVSEAMLSATVDYAGVRQQFGRPIGSFQAVKHACADMLGQISVMRQLVNAAVAEVAAGNDASVSAAMAKSYVGSAAVDVSGKAMQLHGGIGYTWESGVHAYLKRAALNRSLFGSPAMHRLRLAARYG